MNHGTPTGGRQLEPRDAGARLWRPLDGGGAGASLVGAKAAVLDRLVGHGVPVPRAAVLTTAAYRLSSRPPV